MTVNNSNNHIQLCGMRWSEKECPKAALFSNQKASKIERQFVRDDQCGAPSSEWMRKLCVSDCQFFIPLFGVSFAWRLVVIANNAIFGVWCTFYVPTRMKRCPKMPLSDSGLTATSHQHKLWSSVHNHFFRIIKMCKQCQHRHNGSVPWRKRKFWIWITKCREAASVMRCFPHHFQIYVIWVITPHLGFV